MASCGRLVIGLRGRPTYSASDGLGGRVASLPAGSILPGNRVSSRYVMWTPTRILFSFCRQVCQIQSPAAILTCEKGRLGFDDRTRFLTVAAL